MSRGRLGEVRALVERLRRDRLEVGVGPCESQFEPFADLEKASSTVTRRFTRGCLGAATVRAILCAVDDKAATRLMMHWEHPASADNDSRMLFLSARDDAAVALRDLVADGAEALAVTPLALVLLAGDAVLQLSIEGTREEPTLTLELFPTRSPALGAKMVERVERPGQPGSPRARTWTFTPLAGARPITLAHRQVSSAHADEETRARFALRLAALAGWPVPAGGGTEDG